MSVFALVVPAATAAPPAQPAFHITIRATVDEGVTSPFGSGCTENLTRHVEIENAKPLTLTAKQLGNAANYLFELVATETRTDTYTSGCSNRGETSTCGTVSYKIGSIGTGVGFLNRKTDQFLVFYTRLSTDPYQGRCGVRFWGVSETPGSTGKVWGDSFPPQFARHAPWGTAVDRARLTAHKRFVVQWSAAGQVALDSYGTVDDQRGSWQVTLVPVT
jgi:hypothetical protein